MQVKLQKEVISTQKQPGCKKGVIPLKMANVKIVMKSRGQPRHGYIYVAQEGAKGAEASPLLF